MPRDSTGTDLADHFLIAMPGLEDGAFARSVIYLCEHTEDGA
ncbi:MAG: YqgE/AlgH family protein, partial [Tibeticola sp.]